MYEIRIRELKGVDKIVVVHIKGNLAFDAYKNVHRLSSGEMAHLKIMHPDIELAKPEDVQ